MPHASPPPPPPSGPPDWEALGRFLAGESDPAESAAVAAWIAEHPEDARIVQAVNAAADRLGDDLRTPVDTERALAAVLAKREEAPLDAVPSLDEARRRAPAPRTTTSPARVWWRRPGVAAAAVLFVVASVLALRSDWNAPPDAPVRFAAAVGARDSLQLPDGTRVILGPGSMLTHEASYGRDTREVVLEGDGYFDVVHDDTKPFTVRAGRAVIVDLGTAFAVRSDAIRGVTVSVTNGRVRLAHDNAPAEAIELAAGESGLLPEASRAPERDATKVDEAVAWTRGRLVFRDTRFDEAAVTLRRWYGVVVTMDDALRATRLTATFEHEPATTVFETVALSLGADLERRGDTARFRAPGAPPR